LAPESLRAVRHPGYSGPILGDRESGRLLWRFEQWRDAVA